MFTTVKRDKQLLSSRLHEVTVYLPYCLLVTHWLDADNTHLRVYSPTQVQVLNYSDRLLCKKMKRCLSTGNVSTNDQFAKVTRKKAKTQRQKHLKNQTSFTQSSSLSCEDLASQVEMDNAIDSVINQADDILPNVQINGVRSGSCSDSTAVKHCGNSYNCQCNDLKAEIKSLTSTITQLSTKVEFLLSFLGLDDDSCKSTAVNQPQTSSTSNIAAPNGSQNNVHSYANVARPKPTQLSVQMRQAVMAAVYVDLHAKSARANNIVVSGVPKMDNTEDKNLIAELIDKEFNLQPIIKQCKRLGKPAFNKSQSLLVTLDSADHVNTILSDARILRKSLNDFVRANVFINADLTQAEASVAYEERCRRRLQRETHAKKQQQRQQQSTMVSAGITPIGVPHSALNATMPAFQPNATCGTSSCRQSVLPNDPVI